MAEEQGLGSTPRPDAPSRRGRSLVIHLVTLVLAAALPIIVFAAVIGGALRRLLARLVAAGGAIEPSPRTGFTVPFDPELFKHVALQLLDEAGVRYLLHAFATDMLDEGPAGVVFATKSGPVVIRARIVVDAIGAGDVAALAGASYDVGPAEDHLVQPIFGTPHPHEVAVNCTRVTEGLGTSVFDLTRAECGAPGGRRVRSSSSCGAACRASSAPIRCKAAFRWEFGRHAVSTVTTPDGVWLQSTTDRLAQLVGELLLDEQGGSAIVRGAPEFHHLAVGFVATSSATCTPCGVSFPRHGRGAGKADLLSRSPRTSVDRLPPVNQVEEDGDGRRHRSCPRHGGQLLYRFRRAWSDGSTGLPARTTRTAHTKGAAWCRPL
jgi:hypothetical protein